MAANTEVARSVLDALAKFDTPTICNVVELWDIRPRSQGYMDRSICACFPQLPPMVGRAVTTTFRSLAPPRSGDVYAGIAKQLEAFAEVPGPPVVVFQDLDEPTAAATFGEIMCSTYKAFDATGIITSGAGRDLDQVESLGFPAFATGTICAHGYCHMLEINVPVTVGGIGIYPGDLLHGDRNGVTTIPLDIATEVPQACEEFMAAEQVVLDYLQNDRLTPNAYAEARKECSDRITKLRERLRGGR